MPNEKISEYTNVVTTLQDTDLFDTSENQGGPPWESSAVTWATIRAQVDNIYNIDGTLSGNRAVDQDSNTLEFNNVSGFGIGGAPVASSLFSLSSTGEANNMVVLDATGNIGFGTATPSTFMEFRDGNDAFMMRMGNGSVTGPGAVDFALEFKNGSGVSYQGALFAYRDGSGDDNIGLRSRRSIEFWANSTLEVMFKEGGGGFLVGIGTSNPVNKLEVVSDAQTTTNAAGHFTNTNTGGNTYTAVLGDTSGVNVGDNVGAQFSASGSTADNHALILGAGDFSFIDTTPAQITSDQNDYNTNGASSLRLDTDALRNITGFNNVRDGKVLVVHNVGSFDLVIQHENAGSLAVNRVITGNAGTDLTLNAGDSAILKYDNTSQRWRLIPSI